jgi:integrase
MSKSNKKYFTDLGIERLSPPASGQALHWDTKQPGLALFVSYGGTKTFRSTFTLNGKFQTRLLGRFGEITLTEARDLAKADREAADKGIDPRQAKPKPRELKLYGDVVDEFITHYAKPRQRTWSQTERILKRNCAAWLKRPMDAITKQEALTLLRSFVAEGHPYKASLTHKWLKVLWRWAWRQDIVAVNLMDKVEIDIERRERDRVYTDAEIKATWRAADVLDPVKSAFVKLLILLAPRKTALVGMRRSHLDDADNPTLWTTPFELTKSSKRTPKKRVYLTPLPPLAQRIIKSLPKGDDRLFPMLSLCSGRDAQSYFHGGWLARHLIRHGAPRNFTFHAWRHTIATWLENEGASEWERALVLNHAGGMAVTAGYSHGFAGKLKLELLSRWSEHVERLVHPEGAVLLR